MFIVIISFVSLQFDFMAHFLYEYLLCAYVFFFFIFLMQFPGARTHVTNTRIVLVHGSNRKLYKQQ